MIGNLRPIEIILILAIILLLFGAKRLPDAARGLGRSLRIFKAETKGLRDDDGPVETGYSDTQGPLHDPRPLEQRPPVAGPAASGHHGASAAEAPYREPESHREPAPHREGTER